MRAKFLAFSTILTCVAMPIASAETVTTTTFVEPQPLPRTNQINFTVFDVDRDGSYSMPEVGQRLFYVFDSDGNEMIDNVEWDQRAMTTIIPLKSQTFRFVDLNDDGFAEDMTYNYDVFYKDSGLIKFDKNKDGLSAAEFIAAGFENLDDDENKLISLDEWNEAYLASLPDFAETDNYNQ